MRGLAWTALCLAWAALLAVLGVVLVWIYQRVAGVVSPPVTWGPPTYQGQVWIASATLAFTFPLLATHADFFDHWPLRTRDPVPAALPQGREDTCPR